MVDAGTGEKSLARVAIIAWLVTLGYYFYQYVLRSAPAVMIPDLTAAFGISAIGLTSLLGLFYYGYAPFSLVAGAALDEFGPRRVIPLGAAAVGVGAILFASGDATLASIGRFLQGAGGVFALLGAVYIVSTQFPASRAGALIGVTQMFGSAGGSAGQFVVGPLVAQGLGWRQFWLAMGVAGLAIAVLLLLFLPRRAAACKAPDRQSRPWLKNAWRALVTVSFNPQSVLCGLIAGLLFIPTTIFDMVWGVRYLQEAHDVPYAMAVMLSASVPFGWIIGCPLLGWLSDRIGRRKPVIIGGAIVLLLCLILILYRPLGTFPPFSLGLLAGIASGGAMLTYTVIKEAHPAELGGTATGVVNFINFSLSALLGPIFGTLLVRTSGGGARGLEHYQIAFHPLLYGVALAIVLTLFLRETGPAATAASRPTGNNPQSTGDQDGD